jgi:hypothetical protein
MHGSPLFPITNYEVGFTTSVTISLPNISNVALSDSSLGVHKLSHRTTHNLVCPPPPSFPEVLPLPTEAWEAYYPKGSINPTAPVPSGFSFYVSGPTDFQKRAEKAREVLWSYRVMFERGWEWAKGGKLPGSCESGLKAWWTGFDGHCNCSWGCWRRLL